MVRRATARSRIGLRSLQLGQVEPDPAGRPDVSDRDLSRRAPRPGQHGLVALGRMVVMVVATAAVARVTVVGPLSLVVRLGVAAVRVGVGVAMRVPMGVGLRSVAVVRERMSNRAQRRQCGRKPRALRGSKPREQHQEPEEPVGLRHPKSLAGAVATRHPETSACECDRPGGHRVGRGWAPCGSCVAAGEEEGRGSGLVARPVSAGAPLRSRSAPAHTRLAPPPTRPDWRRGRHTQPDAVGRAGVGARHRHR